MCVCVCVCVIKISGKMSKPDSFKVFSHDISFFIQEFLQSKHFLKFFCIKAFEEIHKITEKIKL